MTASRKYRPRRRKKTGLLRNRYLQIAALAGLVIMISSFYIYQRVWVRNLIAEIEDIQTKTEIAEIERGKLKSQWMASSSIIAIENRIKDRKLDLMPTRPSQNLVLRPGDRADRSRYAGLLKALEKLKTNFPLVSSNEAEAGQLFESE